MVSPEETLPTAGIRLTMRGRSISLQTPHYRLRSLRPSDASERYCEWFADETTMAPLNMPTSRITLDELRAHIEEFDNKTRYLIGLFDKATGIHFGVYLVDVLPKHRIAKFNAMLGEADFRGIGAGPETAAALFDHLFNVRGIEKIAGQIIVGNEASLIAAEKLGFVNEGRFRGEIISERDGLRLDQLTFGILRDEWNARQGRTK